MFPQVSSRFVRIGSVSCKPSPLFERVDFGKTEKEIKKKLKHCKTVKNQILELGDFERNSQKKIPLEETIKEQTSRGNSNNGNKNSFSNSFQKILEYGTDLWRSRVESRSPKFSYLDWRTKSLE